MEKLSELKYKRVLLKLSGEVLAGKQKTGVDVETVGKICDKIKEIVEIGVQVAIVVGGGNFWRGRNGHQMERTTADYMGMLATAMNGLALQDALEARGIYSRVQTAIEMRQTPEPFIQRKAELCIDRKSLCLRQSDGLHRQRQFPRRTGSDGVSHPAGASPHRLSGQRQRLYVYG